MATAPVLTSEEKSAKAGSRWNTALELEKTLGPSAGHGSPGPICAETFNSSLGLQASNIAKELEACNYTISSACDFQKTFNDTMKKQLADCKTVIKNFNDSVALCQESMICSCWSEASLRVQEVKDCNIAIVMDKSLKKNVLKCKEAFIKCSKQEDASLEYLVKCYTSQTSLTKIMQEMKITMNMISKLVLKIGNLIGNKRSKTRSDALSCSDFLSKLDKLTFDYTTNNSPSQSTFTNSMSSILGEKVTECTMTEQATLQEMKLSANLMFVKMDRSYVMYQKMFFILTGSKVIEQPIMTTSGEGTNGQGGDNTTDLPVTGPAGGEPTTGYSLIAKTESPRIPTTGPATTAVEVTTRAPASGPDTTLGKSTNRATTTGSGTTPEEGTSEASTTGQVVENTTDQPTTERDTNEAPTTGPATTGEEGISEKQKTEQVGEGTTVQPTAESETSPVKGISEAPNTEQVGNGTTGPSTTVQSAPTGATGAPSSSILLNPFPLYVGQSSLALPFGHKPLQISTGVKAKGISNTMQQGINERQLLSGRHPAHLLVGFQPAEIKYTTILDVPTQASTKVIFKENLLKTTKLAYLPLVVNVQNRKPCVTNVQIKKPCVISVQRRKPCVINKLKYIH